MSRLMWCCPVYACERHGMEMGFDDELFPTCEACGCKVMKWMGQVPIDK